MNLMAIGTMGTYMKNMQLQQKWQQKQYENPLKTENKSVNQTMFDRFKEQQEGAYLQSISYKLQAGESLSPAELEYLRNKSPETYKKAVELEQKRKQYEKALENVETKEEARVLHLNRVANFVARAKDAAAKNDFAASMEVLSEASIAKKVYANFVASDKYAGMAENEAELQDAREAEKEEATGGTSEKLEEIANEPAKEQVKDPAEGTKDTQDVTTEQGEEPQQTRGESTAKEVNTNPQSADVKTASPEQKEAVKAADKKKTRADVPTHVYGSGGQSGTNTNSSSSAFEVCA